MKKYSVSVYPLQAGDIVEIDDEDIVQILPPLDELSKYDCRIVVLHKVNK